MSRNIAFAGLRHGHIEGLFQRVQVSEDLNIVAVCEEDPEALEAFKNGHPEYDGEIYTTLEEMLERSDCEIVAIGDYYARRGGVAIQALKAGRHVLSDKPLCTSLAELDQIEALAANRHLAVGCMLDLRTGDSFVAARNMVQDGLLGELMEIQFSGQHPLMEETRPHWYFEEGKHGGTINDIAIHAFDYLPWMTGLAFDKVVAARVWHTPNTVSPCFKGGAQFMATLSNGCGVMGDVSYAQPTSHGYKMPQYWRFTVWGTKGALEFNSIEPKVTVWVEGETEPRIVTPEPYHGPTYLDWFLMELEGKPAELDTTVVLESAREALKAQKVADQAVI